MTEKLQSPHIGRSNSEESFDRFDPEAAKQARIQALNEMAEKNGSFEKELKESFDKDMMEINNLMTEEVPDQATLEKIDTLMSEAEKYNNELGDNSNKEFPRLMEQFRNALS